MIGATGGRVCGNPLSEVVPPGAEPFFRAILDATLERNAPTTIQDWVDMPAGRQYWIAVLKPLRGLPGNKTRILVTGRNATDDQRAIGRLRRNRLLIERLAEATPGTVYLYEPATRLYSFLGAHSAQTLGHAREGGPRLSDDLIHPDDRGEVERRREALHRWDESKIIECSFRMAHRHGGYRWLQSREMFLTREKGEPIIVGVAIDVTAYIHAQEQVRALSGQLVSLQDEERRRIAQELHDSTAQHLAALSLGMIQLRHLPEDTDAAPVLDDMQAMLTEAHRELSAITYLLHPPYLDVEGLEVSLAHFVNGFGKRSGLVIQLAMSGALQSLPRDYATAIYRIVQEAITNVHRHAEASKAVVLVQFDGAAVHLSVTDDGRGLGARERGKTGGIGLEGMSCRIEQCGGTFEIRTGAGGTTILASLPLERKGSA